MAKRQAVSLRQQITHYIIGFAGALGLTLLAFWLAMNKVLEG